MATRVRSEVERTEFGLLRSDGALLRERQAQAHERFLRLPGVHQEFGSEGLHAVVEGER